MKKLEVECYCGYRSEETPRRFRLGRQWIQVDEVVDRWLSPEHRYFKVASADHAIYILRHDACTDQWALTFFQAASWNPTLGWLRGGP